MKLPKVVPWLIEVFLAPLSLYLVTLVYQKIAFGHNLTAADLPSGGDYVGVSLAWGVTLGIPYFLARSFEMRRRLLSHLGEILKFEFIAIFGFAAWLFFFHPELSRLLFLLFCLGNAFLLVNFHVLVWSKIRWEED